jgi:hypothetical protein
VKSEINPAASRQSVRSYLARKRAIGFRWSFFVCVLIPYAATRRTFAGNTPPGLYRWVWALSLAISSCAACSCRIADKKQGATGITTVAPYIAGQWGRGE